MNIAFKKAVVGHKCHSRGSVGYDLISYVTDFNVYTYVYRVVQYC